MIPEKDISIEYICAKSAGGQHANKTASNVRMTHIPTGISVNVNGRYQHKNKARAYKELEKRLQEEKDKAKAVVKKDKRDKAIHDTKVIRTYNYKRNLVKDHRTGKEANLDKVLDGHIELLQE